MSTPIRFKKKSVGDPLTIGMWEKVTDSIESLSQFSADGGQRINRNSAGVAIAQQPIPAIRLVQLGEDLGPEDGADFRLREGFELYYDPDASTDTPAERWVKSSRSVRVANFWEMPFDKDQRLVVFHAGPNMWVPLPFMQIRHAMTVSDDSGNYPTPETEPDTYAITFIDAEYTEAIGQQGEATEEKSDGPHAYVHNWWDGINSYIPEGKVIWCYAMPKLDTPGEIQWWTVFCCNEENSSSSTSSSAESSSSSSASSTSESSLSSSSMSSGSSSSQSVSTSSSPSSSTSSSTESSTSSSTESSTSSSTDSSLSSNSSSSSSSSISVSFSSISFSTSSVFGHCDVYGPTASRSGDNIRLPIYQLSVEDGVLDCRPAGFDEVDVIN